MSDSGARHSSTKPYLIRAIYEWCADNGLTPYLAVRVDEQTRVPMAYVKNGEIVLNLGVEAVHNLHIGNETISCSGRFGGVSHELRVPMAAVMGIFARETGQGLTFEGQEPEISPPEDGGGASATPSAKPQLRLVK